MRRSARVLCAACLLVSTVVHARSVSCLGRVEPQDGVYELAGPATASVVAELRTDEGRLVARGDVLATMDGHALAAAQLAAAQAELDYARLAFSREERLQGASSQARRDEATRNVRVGEANLAAARATLEQTVVRAPIDGEVLKVHTRQGERIGRYGLLELGKTARMYVVAEVYETDIGRVKTGQPATVTSPALAKPLAGKVERIGNTIGKVDSLGLDPVARTDSRVVEVFVLLDEPQAVADLTNLQVQVEIGE